MSRTLTIAVLLFSVGCGSQSTAPVVAIPVQTVAHVPEFPEPAADPSPRRTPAKSAFKASFKLIEQKISNRDIQFIDGPPDEGFPTRLAGGNGWHVEIAFNENARIRRVTLLFTHRLSRDAALDFRDAYSHVIHVLCENASDQGEALEWLTVALAMKEAEESALLAQESRSTMATDLIALLPHMQLKCGSSSTDGTIYFQFDPRF